MTGRLDGKVAIITGAASGLGFAAATLFVAEGAKVVAADISDDAGAELQDAHSGQLIYTHTDVTREADIEAAVATAVREFGRLDIMYNNAGALGDPSPMLDFGSEGFDSTIGLVARSVLLGHKYAARQFQKQGAGGSIVSTSSTAGLQGGWTPPGYTIGKHAITGIIHSAAYELAPLGIRSNAIAPGVIQTRGMANSFGVPLERSVDFAAFLGQKVGWTQPIGRLGNPEDIAEAALWLGSDASSFVTGVVLPVDGGATAVYQSSFNSAAADAAKEFLSL